MVCTLSALVSSFLKVHVIVLSFVISPVYGLVRTCLNASRHTGTFLHSKWSQDQTTLLSLGHCLGFLLKVQAVVHSTLMLFSLSWKYRQLFFPFVISQFMFWENLPQLLVATLAPPFTGKWSQLPDTHCLKWDTALVSTWKYRQLYIQCSFVAWLKVQVVVLFCYHRASSCFAENLPQFLVATLAPPFTAMWSQLGPPSWFSH